MTLYPKAVLKVQVTPRDTKYLIQQQSKTGAQLNTPRCPFSAVNVYSSWEEVEDEEEERTHH